MSRAPSYEPLAEAIHELMRDDGAPGLTVDLARKARVRATEVEDTTVQRARHLLLDWLGCTLAGASEPATKTVQAVVAIEGGLPCATLFGTFHRVSPRQAALVNGVSAHVLDYDDGTAWMNGHASAPICSAAVAVAEQLGASWDRVLTSIVAGVDIACVLGLSMGSGHYSAGWHPTGTVGGVAAAAACGNLLDLDEASMTSALALAAVHSSGLKASFGHMAKSLQAGSAAATGVLAAELACRGFEANPNSIEGPGGFAQTHTSSFDPARAASVMSGRRGLASVIFKRHACCAGTHSTADGLLALRAKAGFTAEQVRSVTVVVTAQHLSTCAINSLPAGWKASSASATWSRSCLRTGPPGRRASRTVPCTTRSFAR